MFDVGLPELLLIAGVALVVLGPEELPRVMLKMGRFVGSVKRTLGGWQDELERAAEQPAPPRPSLMTEAKQLDAKMAEPELPLPLPKSETEQPHGE